MGELYINSVLVVYQNSKPRLIQYIADSTDKKHWLNSEISDVLTLILPYITCDTIGIDSRKFIWKKTL